MLGPAIPKYHNSVNGAQVFSLAPAPGSVFRFSAGMQRKWQSSASKLHSECLNKFADLRLEVCPQVYRP